MTTYSNKTSRKQEPAFEVPEDHQQGTDQPIQVAFEAAVELLEDTQRFGGQFYSALCNQAVFDIVNNQKVVFDMEDQLATNPDLELTLAQANYLDQCRKAVRDAGRVIDVAYLRSSFTSNYDLSPTWAVKIACEVPDKLTAADEALCKQAYRNMLSALPKDYPDYAKPTLQSVLDEELQTKVARASKYVDMQQRLLDFTNERINEAKSTTIEFFADFAPNDRHLLRICKKAMQTIEKQTLRMFSSRNPNEQADLVIMGEFGKRMDALTGMLELSIETTSNDPFGMVNNATH